MELSAKLQARVQLYEQIRAYFTGQRVTEVFTPHLSYAANPDPAIESFKVDSCRAEDRPMFLQTSPEFFMKRLLVQGSGSIFQICSAFRQGESGRLHNPEFAMLEWYRVGFDYFQLMDDVIGLVSAVSGNKPEYRMVRYAKLFEPYGLNPHTDSDEKIEATALQQGIDVQSAVKLGRDDWLDLFMTHVIEPGFDPAQMLFVHDFPASQASLAQVETTAGGARIAQRFELYWHGMELANGFTELRDADEQLHRFEEQNRIRKRLDLKSLPLDQKFLTALKQGLPECSGVALGLDRLLMIITGSKRISEVLCFADSEV